MAEVELSRSLGIALPANNDIIWVARRALAAKPGGRLKSRTHFFKRLVVQLSEPAWPEADDADDPGDAGFAWIRATALAAFGGENETELSCAKGEPLLVDGGDPGFDGWVVAGRFPDAAETGLVPDSYLRKHEFRVAAQHTCRDCVKGANPKPFRDTTDYRRHPVPHLTRGFVGERHRQNLVGPCTSRHQDMADTRRQNTRFSCSCAGQYL